MTQQIAIITTGGTIGSVAKGGTMAVDPAGARVHQEIEALQSTLGCALTFYSAFNKNSEDLAPEDWALLFAAVDQARQDGFEHIVITHGTDTLSYTAAALGLIYGAEPVRVCLTGSFVALGAANSDGRLNLTAAIQTVLSDDLPTGIYVAFRRDASNNVARIFNALDVRAMAFDALAFASFHDRVVGHVSKDGERTSAEPNGQSSYPSVSAPKVGWSQESLRIASRQILFLRCYPGLSFDRIDHTRLSLLVLDLYHSGTANADVGQGSLRTLLETAHVAPPVIAATYPAQLVPVPYDSTATLASAGLHVVHEVPAHIIYVYAVLQLAAGLSAAEIIESLKPWLLAQKPS